MSKKHQQQSKAEYPRARQVFKGLFGYLGRVEMKRGCRIITNTLTDDWKQVFYSHTQGEVYVLKQILNKEKGMTTLLDYLPEEGKWPEHWRGDKYVNFKLTYQGEFYLMMKHTHSRKAREYIETNQRLEIFQGHFQFNKRHTQTGDTDQLELRQGNNKIQQCTGVWDNGRKQGEFLTQNYRNKNNKFKIAEETEYYFNDIKVNTATDLKKQDKPIIDLPDEFNIGITVEGVKSLNDGSCLYSEMVDLFFKHLNSSFEKCQERTQNMKAFTVYMFEKLVPSGKVSNQRKDKVNINYSGFENIGKVYQQTTSIFEVNPLILMPLNRDKSHFALGAISTEVKRDQNQNLQSVKFTLFYLDPLHNTEECVPEIMREYIKRQINANLCHDPKEIKIYLSAADNATIEYKNSQFNRQLNEVDCGVFTCIYGFLLTYDLCHQGKETKHRVKWQWRDKKAPHAKDEELIRWVRRLIKEDAYVGVYSFWKCIENEFIQREVLFPYKPENKGYE